MDKIEKIRQEIDRRLKKAEYEMTKASGISHDNFIIHQAESNLCRFLLDFLDTLSEEPDKDLEKETSTWIPAHISGGNDEVRNTKSAVIEWAGIVARHFAQWGAEHAKKDETPVSVDLEEVAWDCVLDSVDVNNPVLLPKYKELLTYLFIAGAKWQAEQDDRDVVFWKGMQHAIEGMKKDAVECELYWDGDFLAIDLNMAELGYSERDKVRIIVLPKED